MPMPAPTQTMRRYCWKRWGVNPPKGPYTSTSSWRNVETGVAGRGVPSRSRGCLTKREVGKPLREIAGLAMETRRFGRAATTR